VHKRGMGARKEKIGKIVVKSGVIRGTFRRLCQLTRGGYPSCYGENFSTFCAKPGCHPVEKGMAMRFFHTFHRVFNTGKVEMLYKLYNGPPAAEAQGPLHFWRTGPGRG